MSTTISTNQPTAVSVPVETAPVAPPIAPKKLEPFNPRVDIGTYLNEPLPTDFKEQHLRQLQRPPERLITETSGAILTYLEQHPDMKQSLLESAQQKMKLKPGDEYYESALNDQLIRDAFQPVVDSMRITNIRIAGKAVMDEVERYVKLMQLRGNLDSKRFGVLAFKFDPRKHSLATSRGSIWEKPWNTPAGREKLLEQAAGESQETLREYITGKLHDEAFAELPRDEQCSLIDSAMITSRERMQKLGEALLSRGDAVGGVVLSVSGEGTDKSTERFEELAGSDRAISRGISDLYQHGGDIILTDGRGMDPPRFVRMGPRNKIIGCGRLPKSQDGIFADYILGPTHVLKQMLGRSILLEKS